MKPINRRDFLKGTVKAGGALAAPAFIRNFVRDSPNDRIHVAVAGISGDRPRVRGLIRGRGIRHVQGYAQVPGVRVATLCDVDERLFPDVAAETETLYGSAPKTEVDFRRVLEDRDIDVVSIATPDHWHALQTIWACQADKDVYVEKPVSYNVSEGRKMVQAARKYDRIVLGGMTRRFSRGIHEGVKFVHEGGLGKVYMAKTVFYRFRPDIGRTPEGPVPPGVHWELFLGPAPWRPFSENRFHYNWHWMWDTGTTEVGNNGIYQMDIARWALQKDTHPVRIHATGGLYGRDDDQEVPNTLMAVCEYEDGVIMQNEIRGWYTNTEGDTGAGQVTFVYGEKGWIELTGNGFKTFFGSRNEPGPSLSADQIPEERRINGWKEFIGCVRSRRLEDLRNDILEGHLSATVGHLGLISYRTGRKLTFDPDTERFVGDPEADSFLTRTYRPPYTMPEHV